MAKKRKSDRQARDQRMYANTRVWMWEAEPPNDRGSDFVLHVQKKALLFGWCDITDQRLIDNLFERTRNWVICGRALVQQGDQIWMEQADMTLPSCKILDVRDAYASLREEVLRANQTRHVFDCGWIAQTWLGTDPTDGDPDWLFHDAPPGLAPEKVVGPGFSEERRQRWQAVNKREQEKLREAGNE